MIFSNFCVVKVSIGRCLMIATFSGLYFYIYYDPPEFLTGACQTPHQKINGQFAWTVNDFLGKTSLVKTPEGFFYRVNRQWFPRESLLRSCKYPSGSVSGTSLMAHCMCMYNCLWEVLFFVCSHLLCSSLLCADHVISTGRQMTNLVSNFECLFWFFFQPTLKSDLKEVQFT